MSTSGNSYLAGEFRHYLDDKNRVTIPSAWRKKFPEGSTFLAVPGAGAYVTVLPPAEVEKLQEKFAAVQMFDEEGQDLINAFMATAQEINFDSQGRIALSSTLFEHAGLTGPKDEVVLIGSLNKFNIFSAARWAEAKAKTPSTSQKEGLRRLGF